ncbi:MAG: fibronectin type III domain-containing protein [Nitrospinae bacterium]|nr:fibronectin type III domain-containing protein [Nitrospinota bacterium]
MKRALGFITVLGVVALLSGCSGSGSSGSDSAGPSLPVPTTVTVAEGDSQITLNWDTMTGATSYNVYWSLASDVTKSSSRLAGIAGNSYSITGLANNTVYYFAVTAMYPEGESEVSAIVSATPRVPVPDALSRLSLSSIAGQVTLSWDSVDRATTYNIYWNNTGGVTALDNRISSLTSTSTTHTGLTTGTPYFYRVAASNDSGEGPLSAEFSVIMRDPSISAPAGISMEYDNTGQLTLVWSAVSTAQSYNLYYNNSGNVTIQDSRIVMNSALTYSLSGLNATLPYFFMVTAFNTGAESDPTIQVGISLNP